MDFDELWLLIGDWQHHNGKGQDLAIAAGLAMARAHLRAGYDVVAAQFALGQDFFEAIDAIVAETASACHESLLTGHPERVATQFRLRRTERTLAGESDVSTNSPDDRVDEVIAWAATELTALAAARPHTTVISTEGDVDSTYMRVREALQRCSG